MGALNTFEVDHRLDSVALDMAPFDTHPLHAVAFVIEKATNTSLPILAFAAGEGQDNFVVSSYWLSSGGSNYTYDSGTGAAPLKIEFAATDITVARSRLARAFTICLLLVNLTLTICSAYITTFVITREEKVESAILVLPVTLILTIPALRALYVGSPPFGIFIGRSRVLGS